MALALPHQEIAGVHPLGERGNGQVHALADEQFQGPVHARVASGVGVEDQDHPPLGQKALSVLPQLSIELQGEGMKLGEKLGRQSMMEVLSEHPELQKALEEAQKGAQPQ